MNTHVMPYDSTAISVPTESVFCRVIENGYRPKVGASDRTAEALVTRLEQDGWISVSNAGSLRHVLNRMFDQAQNAVSGFFLGPRSTQTTAIRPMASPTRGSPEALLKLVEKWLAEDKGYDANVWPVIWEDIEEYRLSDRDRFHG